MLRWLHNGRDRYLCFPKDLNLCTKMVQVEVKEKTGWEQLEQAFKELNLKLPTPYPVFIYLSSH